MIQIFEAAKAIEQRGGEVFIRHGQQSLSAKILTDSGLPLYDHIGIQVSLDQFLTIKEVISNFKTKSQVILSCDEGFGFSLAPPPIFESSKIGGANITMRPEQEMNRIMPGLSHALENTNDKIVILGNGLSPLPIKLAERYAVGSLNECPVILDVFDYKKLLEDLNEVSEILKSQGLPSPYHYEQEILLQMVSHIDHGHLLAIKHVVGIGAMPSETTDASLVINLLGPPPATIGEQLQLLGIGGKLMLMPFAPQVDEQKYKVEPLDLPYFSNMDPASRRKKLLFEGSITTRLL